MISQQKLVSLICDPILILLLISNFFLKKNINLGFKSCYLLKFSSMFSLWENNLKVNVYQNSACVFKLKSLFCNVIFKNIIK